MRIFVHLLRTPDTRYAIGAMVSWPVYGTLYITLLKIFDRHYSAAAGVSWILSYGVVYAFQKYGTFGAMGREAMLREIGRYAFAVVGLTAAVNLGLVTVLADFDPTLNKITAVAAGAVPAALVAWFVSTRVLRIGTRKVVLGSAENANRFHDKRLTDASSAEAYVNREWQEERVQARYEWLFCYNASSAAI